MKITQRKIDRKFNEVLKELLVEGFEYVPVRTNRNTDGTALVVLEKNDKYYALLEALANLGYRCYKQTLQLVELDQRTAEMVRERVEIDYYWLQHSGVTTLEEYYQIIRVKIHDPKRLNRFNDYFKYIYFLTKGEADIAIKKHEQRKVNKEELVTTSISVNTPLNGFKKNARFIRKGGHYYLVNSKGRETLILAYNRHDRLRKVYYDKTSKNSMLNVIDWKKVG